MTLTCGNKTGILVDYWNGIKSSNLLSDKSAFTFTLGSECRRSLKILEINSF